MHKRLRLNKKITKQIKLAFKNDSQIFKYSNDENTLSIDILRCPNSPYTGFESFSTIGLSEYSMIKDGSEFPTRVELVGSCSIDEYNEYYANILMSIAFYIIETSWLCSPGSVLTKIIELYYNSYEMKHILFVRPFLWDNKLNTVIKVESKIITWLQIIPISDNECLHWEKNGPDSLLNLFENKQIDIFDLSRSSVI